MQSCAWPILGKIAGKVKFTFYQNFVMMQAMKITSEKIAIKKNIP